MTDKEVAWTQVFQDRDIPDTLLKKLQGNVMAQIFAQPVDFKEALLLAHRRRWGLLLGGNMLLAGLILLGLLGIVGTGTLWQFLGPKLNAMVSMAKGMELIWQEYSWTMLGATVVLLLLISDIRTLAEPKV